MAAQEPQLAGQHDVEPTAGRSHELSDRLPVRLRGRWLVLAAVSVVLLALVSAWLFVRSTSGLTAGPLYVGTDINQVSFPTRVGGHWTWSLNEFDNNTDDSMVIDKVMIPSTDPRMIRSVSVQRPTTSAGLTAAADNGAYRWPPTHVSPGDLVSPAGVVIGPHQATTVFAEVVMPPTKRAAAGPVVVYYHIGDTHYRVSEATNMTLCSVKPGKTLLEGLPGCHPSPMSVTGSG